MEVKWITLEEFLSEYWGSDNAFLGAKDDETARKMWADMDDGTFSLDDIT